MTLNQKNLIAVMQNLHDTEDTESYNELLAAIRVLNNLGLVDDNLRKAMIKKDNELWEEVKRYNQRARELRQLRA